MRFLKFFKFGCADPLLLCVGFSLVAASGGYSLVAMCRLLIVVAPLWSMGSRGAGFSSCGVWAQ